MRNVFSLGLLLMALFVVDRSWAQEDDEQHRFVPGLLAHYSDGARSTERIDGTMGGWTSTPVAAGLRSGPFEVAWRGYILVRPEGRFRFHAHGRGHVRLEIDGNVVIDARLDGNEWLSSAPIELLYGWRTIAASYQNERDSPALTLAWNGPGFRMEPLTENHLFHEAEATVDDRYQRGLSLIRQLRCQACHILADGQDAYEGARAPDLTHLSGNLSHGWLENWLASDGLDQRLAMPDFGLSREQAQQIASHLFANSEPARISTFKDASAGDAAAGERVFVTVGCLACHGWGELQPPATTPHVDLTQVGAKRSSHFFQQYLTDPKRLNSAHRMPVMALSAQERNDLVAFLTRLRKGSQAPDDFSPHVAASQPGARLFVRFQCARCHQVDAPVARSQRTRITADADWRNSCLNSPDAARHRPGYNLADDEHAAIQHVIQQAKTALDLSWSPGVRSELRSRGCLSCHARGTAPGVAPVALQVAQSYPELASIIPALVPPSLNRIGEKLLPEALAQAIRASDQRRRPWLTVRMPRYQLSDDEIRSLVRALTQSDRFPGFLDTFDARVDQLADETLTHAGTRLVTPGGFGCTSCHPIGGVQPPEAPLNARGPDLARIGTRVRRSWFDRWVHNPARIVPRIEMPAIEQPVPGVLDQNLDQQLSAVWHVLNQPDFRPPPPHAMRIVRRSGVKGTNQRAVVLTDVLDVENRRFIKPFLVALPNRHNALYDLESGRLAAWTIGDAASQRTQGKSWFWQSAGSVLLPLEMSLSRDAGSDVMLTRDGRSIAARRQGQFVTQADRWIHLADGLEMHFRLHFEGRGPLAVRQRFRVLARAGSESGWRRTLSFTGVDRGDGISVRLIPQQQLVRTEWSPDRRLAHLSPLSRIRLVSPAGVKFEKNGMVRLPRENPQAKHALIVDYRTRIPVDEFSEPQAAPLLGDPVPVDVVPGFVGYRLPVGSEMMPTGMAWRPSGTLIVTSLEGRVWSVTDEDGDGFEDNARSIADELAAPFGVAATDQSIDVVNKYGLLRLFDDDRDQHAERVITLASGWGHTADYHDWAIGLPSDEHGGYFVALACQQDERSEAAAHLRGRVIRLDPTTAAPDKPMSYSIHEVSAGHRFPIGLARSPEGQLFVTDNQGNYNPYNELNHVRPGAHFGFINKLDSTRAERPELAAPAINIPHPWTRSVNGICFLTSPTDTSEPAADFGPFAGHLIGCEYDTRRLVRFSLQKVGETFQGAAYPFSIDRDAGPNGFLGPVTCAISPGGDLYVGDLRESGWGGGQNVGTIVRLTPNLNELPPGIAEVRATFDGFQVRFTRPIDPELAADAAHYAISSVKRTSTPVYGGEDQDRRQETIEAVAVSSDRLAVNLRLGELRSGYVYEFHLRNLSDQRVFHPAEAYYTLNVIPTQRD